MTKKSADYDHLFKILLIGDSGAGKSSAMLRFSENKFSPSFISTIGIDFRVKTITLDDGTRVKLQCWDTAGQERFRTITTAYFRGANGIIVMYDVTDNISFANVSHWVRTIDTHAAEHKHLTKMLVASKCDLTNKRLISAEQGQELARSIGATRLTRVTRGNPQSSEILYAEISSKTGHGVDAMFTTIANAMLAHTKELAQTKQAKTPRQLHDPYTVDEKIKLKNETRDNTSKSTCC